MLLLLALLACAPSRKKIESFTRPVDASMKVESTPELVARGAYIANTIGVCIECHSGRSPNVDMTKEPERFNEMTDVLGGYALNAGGKSVFAIPGITPDRVTGLGGWTDDEIRRAIRDGINKDGNKLLSFMPFMQYQYMSDADVNALVAYLRSVQPVNKSVGETDIPFVFETYMRRQGHDPVATVPEPDRTNQVEYGKYLVHLGHCAECHSAGLKWHGDDKDPKYLSGSMITFRESTGKYPAPNLTPDKETGIGNYTRADMVRALKTGTRLDGQMMQVPMGPFADAYGHMTDEDLEAIAAYLFSLPPVEQKQKKRELNELGDHYAAVRRQALDARLAQEAAAKEAAAAGAAVEAASPGKKR